MSIYLFDHTIPITIVTAEQINNDTLLSPNTEINPMKNIMTANKSKPS